ncbi:MAG: DsrE family protein [Thiovulaceae bacterium]|jgi:intracellular sulfur oxidation DsrE/DsrF family protein|nr:DsrE family protein [Sulfurimonadaceae bacterium]
MKQLLLTLLLGMCLSAQEGYKAVYDLATSKLETIENRFIKGVVANKNHYENKLQELEVRVIIHGGAYKFFVKDPEKTVFKGDKELAKADKNLLSRLRALQENYDVKFYMCQAGATSKKLTREDVYEFVEFIPNTTIGLIDAQNEGFAYVPVH